MDYIIIEVPDLNDSESRIVLCGVEYRIRFTYISEFDYWIFSIYDSQGEPIVLGVKIVPSFPLNAFLGLSQLPEGLFGAMSKKEKIGRKDFVEGKAKFIFCPVSFD